MFAVLEAFDFEAVPTLDKRLLRDLAVGDYLKDRRNVILTGKSGAGKTHLATAPGIEACHWTQVFGDPNITAALRID
ncbi:MAG: ATP-binding protein [Pelovirga sp.]